MLAYCIGCTVGKHLFCWVSRGKRGRGWLLKEFSSLDWALAGTNRGFVHVCVGAKMRTWPEGMWWLDIGKR